MDKSHGHRTTFSPLCAMTDLGPVALRLKRLRELTEPKLTVRATAELLGLASSTYATYEDDKKYKKALLPQNLTAQLADLFGKHGVDRSHVMALGGLNAGGQLQTTPESLADQLDAVLIPELDVGYSMGGGADVDDFPIVQMVPLSRSWLAGLTGSSASHLFVARGDGDSMIPTLLDNDLVIVDRSERTLTRQDRIWAVTYGGFGMIKRIRALPDGSIQINSDNPAVSPIVAADGEAYLIGRVVGVVRRM